MTYVKNLVWCGGGMELNELLHDYTRIALHYLICNLQCIRFIFKGPIMERPLLCLFIINIYSGGLFNQYFT